jgi:uncharacterized repeat protein (TIGR01451 family)
MQWFGHASRYNWGSFVALNYNDPPTFDLNDSWPITAHFTCYSGYFANLSFNLHALGEILARTPLRGSIADFSSAGANLGGSLLVLNEGLTQAIFLDRVDQIGHAVDAARLYYFQNSGGLYNVIDTFILFGDPALRLRLPEAPLETSTAEVSPSQALPDETLHYTVTVQNTGAFTLTDVLVEADYDQARGQVTASSPPAGDADGVLTWSLPELPPGPTLLVFDLALDAVQPAGVTPIHAPVTLEAYGVPWLELDAVSAVVAAPDLSTSSLEANRAWAPPGFPLTYTVTLSNTGHAPSTATWLTATLPAELTAIASPDLTYDPAAHRLAWQGPVGLAEPVTLSFSGVITPSHAACGPIEVLAALRDELGQVTSLAAPVQPAVPDVDCDGDDVDVADIQQVAARWGEAAGSPAFDPRYDLDGDDLITVQDIIIAAGLWQ